MNFIFLILILDIIGVGVTVYLIRMRQAGEKPVCPIGNDCHKVLASEYNRLFFVHNDLLGLFFYLASIVFSVMLLNHFGPENMLTLLFGCMLASGAALSVLFVYVQWRVIRAWCFWCVFSAMNVWIIGILFLIQKTYL